MQVLKLFFDPVRLETDHNINVVHHRDLPKVMFHKKKKNIFDFRESREYYTDLRVIRVKQNYLIGLVIS